MYISRWRTSITAGSVIRFAVSEKTAGLSQEDLAGAIGLTRTSVSNIENGRQKVLLYTFEKILRVLNVQPSDLLPETASVLRST